MLKKINKVRITLYRVGYDESITVFDYDNGITTIDPVSYGTLTEEDMRKLCNKVEEVMRRNPRLR